MGVLKAEGFVAVMCAGEEDNGTWGDWHLHPHLTICCYDLPGTSSVSGSLRMPRFHLRLAPACFSLFAGVVPSADVDDFRHGVKLTILSCEVCPGESKGGGG